MVANRGDIIRKTTATGIAMLAFTAAGAVLSAQALAAPGDPIGPINPVAQVLNGHPANSGFLVFVEGDVQLNADEAEGTIALGGDLAFTSAYNIAAGAVPPATITVAPDTSPVYLYVGGGVTWPDDDGLILRVLNNGFAKIADTTTYAAATVDQNGATVAWHVFEPDATYESQPRIEGTITQTPESIAEPVPTELLDIAGAFGLYRDTTAQLSLCTPTIDLTDTTGAAITPPYPAGGSGALRLVPGQTNVFEIAADDLARLGEISFPDGGPSPDTPLLVNVTGETFLGTTPNLAGVSNANAPFILWNFPDATAVTVTGGDSIEGTLYAPNAVLNWQVTQNIEGNVIAAEFIHGMPASGPVGTPREVHGYPFDAELSCIERPGPAPTTTTATPTTSAPPTTVPPTTAPPTTPAPVPTTTTPATPAGGGLPATGWDPTGIVWAALLALTGAAALVIGYRRPSVRRVGR
ncbi:choice-of-anchor A family protein [Agromyces silvae]|uniref:choice-of-anchor A family protein n=1 Tax=Agromyces silvae TaxID=3388266 RepID=UPI00280BAEF9|nr:choice-of-anchor A family protein [Agromyces protaetiae]